MRIDINKIESRKIMEKNNKNQKLVLRKDQEGEQVLTRLTKKKMREHSSYKSLE